MLAPRKRLLLLFGIVALPSALLPALNPSLTPGWSLAAPMVLGFVALMDAAWVMGGLKAVGVRHSGVTRCSRGREAVLPLELHVPGGGAEVLRVSVSMPHGLSSLQDEQWLRVPEGGTWVRFDWGFCPKERGQYRVPSIRLGLCSRLGLWDHWVSRSLNAELRCYPNIALERRPLAALFLNRGALGLHAQRQVGQGREFEKLREYVPGDGYDEIHWKATAKRGQPVTKVFKLERTQEVYVVIDTSRLSARPVPRLDRSKEATLGDEAREPVLERYLTAGLVLGQAAEHQGDLFGLAVFSDRVQRFVRSGSGSAHFHACRDALYALRTQQVSPDFEELGAFIRSRLRRRALLVYLTSLDDPVHAESFLRHATLLARQHLLVVLMVRPVGVQPLFSGKTPADAEEVYEHLGAHLRWQTLREHGRALQQRGVLFHLVESDSLGMELVSHYMKVKNRQLL